MSRDTALGLRGERFGDSEAFFQGFMFFNFRELFFVFCSSPSQSEKWNSTVRYRKIRKSKCLLFSDVFWKSVPLLWIFYLVKVLLIRSVTKRPGTREHITKRAAILTKKKDVISRVPELFEQIVSLWIHLFFFSPFPGYFGKKRCIYMHMSYVAYPNLPWLWTNQWRHPESYEKATVTCRLFATRCVCVCGFYGQHPSLWPLTAGSWSSCPPVRLGRHRESIPRPLAWRARDLPLDHTGPPLFATRFFSGNCCQATLDFLRDLEDSSQVSCKTPISVNPYSIQCEMASLESKKKRKGCSTESILHVHIFKCCFQRFETYFSQLCQVATLTSISQCTSKIKKIQKIKRSKRSKV